MDAGASEGLGSPLEWSAWSQVHTASHTLALPVVHQPFLSNSHLLTVTIVIHSMATE